MSGSQITAACEWKCVGGVWGAVLGTPKGERRYLEVSRAAKSLPLAVVYGP